MRNIKLAKESFEILDGGHCYLRAHRDNQAQVSVSRFPERLSDEDAKDFGEWLLGKISESKEEKPKAYDDVCCDCEKPTKEPDGRCQECAQDRAESEADAIYESIREMKYGDHG
jgi:hypothetical protein